MLLDTQVSAFVENLDSSPVFTDIRPLIMNHLIPFHTFTS